MLMMLMALTMMLMMMYNDDAGDAADDVVDDAADDVDVSRARTSERVCNMTQNSELRATQNSESVFLKKLESWKKKLESRKVYF